MEGRAPSGTLRERGLRPRKRLGQNFLQDRSVPGKIADAARLEPNDVVLEIGPGTGVLTRELAARAGRVVAIELDDQLASALSDDLLDCPTVTVVQGNALDVDPCELFDRPYKLVANIPYYITGPILRHFLEAECRPELMVLMVQREVADRIVARAGDLSLLGVSVQWYADAQRVIKVPAGAFYPRPKVDSAVIRLTPFPRGARAPITESFFEVARAGFGTRRKQLANALAGGLGLDRDSARGLLSAANIAPERRAEELSLAEWEDLARVWDTRRL